MLYSENRRKELEKLKQNLLKIQRDKNYAYVSDGFMPHLRKDPHFKQVKRILQRLTLATMTPTERNMLHNMLQIRAVDAYARRHHV